MVRGDGTKEANVLIKSRGNVETSPSLGVFAIFRKFRFARARRGTAFKVAMEEKEGWDRIRKNEVPEQPPFASPSPPATSSCYLFRRHSDRHRYRR